MYYNLFQDECVSALGFGLMRLPHDKNNNILVDEARNLIEYAINHGVNYFETAQKYHNGQVEKFASQILLKYPRDSYNIALKCLTIQDYDRIFFSQLKETNFNYADYYLLHGVGLNVGSVNSFKELINHSEVISFYQDQVHKGLIRHLGFSSHMNSQMLQQFLDKYHSAFEFIQIQLNYYDYNFEDVKKQLDIISSYNLPIWVMEPLRGGNLCNLDISTEDTLEHKLLISLPEIAFRWIQTYPNVKVILSGMSTLEQVKQNINIFNTKKLFTPDEFNYVADIGKTLTLNTFCSDCKYCLNECPNHNNIPEALKTLKKGNINTDIHITCNNCKKCTQVCPQSINIPDILNRFYKEV